MRRVYAFLYHLYLLIDFFLSASWIRLLYRDPIKQRQALVNNTARTARGFIKAFQIKLQIVNPQGLDALRSQNHLIIANHVSYTDIIILSSIFPFVYITSVEMSENPFLGDITRLGGCLFTNRKKFNSLPQEIENFASALKQGFNVVLFPEGTSTNGETIKDFRKSLFQVAIHAKVPVLPICIKYTHIDDKPIEDSTRDLICWYGDMTFAPHFSKLLGRKIRAEVHVLEPIPWQDSNNRGMLSDVSRERLLDCFHSKA